jgi:hemoglobin-like flavoprotein
VNASRQIERWVRHHVNGWRAEAIRDEEGHWGAAAHPAGQGGIVSMVGNLELAQAVAESRIPRHECSEWTCGPWIRNSTAGEAPITGDHVTMVRASFARVALQAESAGALFYRRLFEIDPSLRPLFPGDMSDQRRKLMAMVEFAVTRLDQVQELLPVIEALGVRHGRYGVIQKHYDSFGAAWLWTLAHELGTDFTAEVKDAWLAVYGLLANVMKGSAAAVGNLPS